MAVVYDEFYISTMREISVCRRNIGKLTKTLEKLERKYGRKTPEFIKGSGGEGAGDGSDDRVWRDTYQGLKRWEERLREFTEILEGYSSQGMKG